MVKHAKSVTALEIYLLIFKLRGCMKDRSHDEYMAEYFRLNPLYAIELFAALQLNGDPAELDVLQRQLNVAYNSNVERPAGKISE